MATVSFRRADSGVRRRYHIDRLRKAPIGYFFDVDDERLRRHARIRAQIAPRDRWCIAAYIRALQLSQNATSADIPAGQKVPSPAPQFRDIGNGATLPEVAAAHAASRRGTQMTTATMNKSDLMAPPVAQTIQQRSLVIGVIGAIASDCWRISCAGRVFTPPT